MTRWRYHDHVAERMVTGFLEPIHAWCAAHGIASTGHLVEENTLQMQTVYDGEVMRGYRAMSMPGMDLHGHLLASLTPRPVALPSMPGPTIPKWRKVDSLDEPIAIRLAESNALPLDRARWRWNDEPWQPPQELRDIEDSLRLRFGMQLRRSYCAQPWCDTEATVPLGALALEFDICSDILLDGGQLALEQPTSWKVALDGASIDGTDKGWWVDEAIRCLRLPSLTPGVHRLRIATTFTRATELEWLYLLGGGDWLYHHQSHLHEGQYLAAPLQLAP